VTQTCLHAFEQRLNTIDERLDGQPRQDVVLSRLQVMIYKKLHELMNHNLQPYGVNDTLWTALIMLYSSPEHYIYPSDLSHIIDASRTSITRFADDMVEKGWVSRAGCESDRRKIVLTLTEAGIALVESVMPLQWKLYLAVWQDFSPAEKVLMEKLQRKLIASLSALDSPSDGASPAIPGPAAA
jgi:MarR family transcriptional repressor of emrRAB